MNLARIQFLSLFSKGVTMTLGIIQTLIVIRLLTPGEYGLAGLVLSIGGVIGVSQHLGIVDGAIREIAILKDKKAIGKVMWVSHFVRQAVTLPLSLGLVALAGVIAIKVYHRPEIIPYIQLFAVVLILQALQDVLGATLTGMKKFVSLYAVQIITAALNIAIFGYLTWQFRTTGYFWAIIITTLIMVVLLAIAVSRSLRGALLLPTWHEVRAYGRQVMRVGAYMYLSRIFFVIWQRLPMLLLGTVITAEELGYITVSLTFGSRLTIIASALAEVNLAWMSALYSEQRDAFREIVTRNLQRVLLLMSLIALVLLFFTPELLRYVVGAQYMPAQHLIIVMTLAFFLYSLTDIGTNSIQVAANKPHSRALLYGLMMATTAVIITWLLYFRPDALLAGYGVLAGALVAYIGMLFFAHKHFHISLLSPQLAVLLAAFGASSVWFFYDPALPARAAVFVLLSAYVVWEAHRSQLLPPSLLARITGKNAASGSQAEAGAAALKIICFAGASYHQPTWTNRQHMMARLAKQYPVLYVEPRVWIIRALWRHRTSWRESWRFLRRLIWHEQAGTQLYLKAQWNLLPGSREVAFLSFANHLLNRYCVLFTAWYLGFRNSGESAKSVVWIYDTEAAEYLSAFPGRYVLYDCVDEHAAQAGADRNPQRVEQEEERICQRADMVTVTSRRLYELKKAKNRNTHLVLNAGDVASFLKRDTIKPVALAAIPQPIFGLVGALDAYKLDVALIQQVAQQKTAWHFVLIGAPVIDKDGEALKSLRALPNVHFLGQLPREKVPAYVHHFDVCLIPYLANRYNEASFPLKFWEFMATGKPVIVSGLPELKEFAPLASYVQTADELIAAGEKCLHDSSTGAAGRIALAQEHTWEKRVAHIKQLLTSQLGL